MFIAIVREENGRVTKHKTFSTKPDADKHIVDFSGVAVFEYSGAVEDLLIRDGVVSISPPAPEPLSEEELTARAMKALQEKFLREEMEKPSPIPEVAELKRRKGK